MLVKTLSFSLSRREQIILKQKDFLFILFKGISCFCYICVELDDASDSKEAACHVEDLGLIPESGRSPGEGNGNPLQYSCLENSMDRGTWWAIVHGVAWC